MAKGLLASGVGKGTRVGLLAPNSPEWVVAWLAATRIGAVVPMLNAIDITGKTSGNFVIESAMEKVGESVRAGGSLTTPMRAEPAAFPVMVTQMIGVGEETGALEAMLSKIADFYEDEVAAGLKALTSILEPLMIILVGAIVGFIVVAMYMPMFKVYDSIR